MTDDPENQKGLPPCGLYRTGRALASDPEQFPAGILVMFHNHSDQKMPMLQLPAENERNHWTFYKHGPGIQDDDEFIRSLEPLREQGVYYLAQALQTPDGLIPANTLVQLGYNRKAHPILFMARRHPVRNALQFSDQGYGFEDLEILQSLAPDEPLAGVENTSAEPDEDYLQ